MDASSGENQRQRLNTGGNRQLDAVLHIIAACQSQRGGPRGDCYARKISEGKTPREARSAVKKMSPNPATPATDHQRQGEIVLPGPATKSTAFGTQRM